MAPDLVDDVLWIGPQPATTDVTVIALPGRDQGPEWIVDALVEPVGDPTIAWVVPRAPGDAWYPHRFDDPIADNEPQLSDALRRIDDLVADIDVDPAALIVTGFSQGACLVNEYVARHPERWGGVVSFTGGRIGPESMDLTIVGDLDGTPVHFSAGDADPWISPSAIHAAARSFEEAGAAVSVRLFPGDADHRIRPQEVEVLRNVIASMRASIAAGGEGDA
jgi:predicted esterase